MLSNSSYNGPLIDIWACGVMLYVMLSGKYPFHADDFKQNCHEIINSQPLTLDGASADAKDLVTKMLEKDPQKRISIDEILKHPWLASQSIVSDASLSLASSE